MNSPNGNATFAAGGQANGGNPQVKNDSQVFQFQSNRIPVMKKKTIASFVKNKRSPLNTNQTSSKQETEEVKRK